MIEGDGDETVYCSGVRAMREETDAELRDRVKAILAGSPDGLAQWRVDAMFMAPRRLVPIEPLLIVGVRPPGVTPLDEVAQVSGQPRSWDEFYAFGRSPRRA